MIENSFFSGANLREEFEITALFHIPKKYPCSYAFAQMEQAKKELLIDDYSIQQTSLEQVIIFYEFDFVRYNTNRVDFRRTDVTRNSWFPI